MNSELYTAASGLLVQERRLEIISNNLANVSSTAFRAQRLFTRALAGASEGLDGVVGQANRSVTWDGTYEVPGLGAREPTGRSLDVALAENQYLEVSTKAGPRYTRAGALQIDPDGTLTDEFANPILGADGAPLSNLPGDARVTSDGRLVHMQEDEEVALGQLRVRVGQREQLLREGSGLYAPSGRGALRSAEAPSLSPGYLERSGTNALSELVHLIDTQRAFESYQKVISITMNEVNRRTVRDIAA